MKTEQEAMTEPTAADLEAELDAAVMNPQPAAEPQEPSETENKPKDPEDEKTEEGTEPEGTAVEGAETEPAEGSLDYWRKIAAEKRAQREAKQKERLEQTAAKPEPVPTPKPKADQARATAIAEAVARRDYAALERLGVDFDGWVKHKLGEVGSSTHSSEGGTAASKALAVQELTEIRAEIDKLKQLQESREEEAKNEKLSRAKSEYLLAMKAVTQQEDFSILQGRESDAVEMALEHFHLTGEGIPPEVIAAEHLDLLAKDLRSLPLAQVKKLVPEWFENGEQGEKKKPGKPVETVSNKERANNPRTPKQNEPPEGLTAEELDDWYTNQILADIERGGV